MPEFEQLQQLWQQQPEVRLKAADVRALRQEFERFGRRQRRISAGKLIAVSLVLVWALTRGHHSVWAMGALGMVAVMALLMLWLEWRGQRALARLNFADAPVEFVRAAIARLEEQCDPFRRYRWPIVVCILVALNTIVVGAGATARERWWAHIAVSVLPFGVYHLGSWVRRKRFEHFGAPLLERLRAMLAAMEDQSL